MFVTRHRDFPVVFVCFTRNIDLNIFLVLCNILIMNELSLFVSALFLINKWTKNLNLISFEYNLKAEKATYTRVLDAVLSFYLNPSTAALISVML